MLLTFDHVPTVRTSSLHTHMPEAAPARARSRPSLFGIAIDPISLADLLDTFDRGLVVTPNVDHFMILRENAAFRDVFRDADFVVVDSRIVQASMQFLGRPVPEKISGSDLLPAYYRYHAKRGGKSLFILGGRPGVPEAAMARINAKTNTNIVVGAHAPSMNFVNDEPECRAVIQTIIASGANTLVTCLGSPKQEIWIQRHRSSMPSITSFLAVGAAVDFEAGTQPRAPVWVSRAGLEWAFRLVREPRRLWRRYLVRDPKFLLLVLRERFRSRVAHARPTTSRAAQAA